MKKRPWLGNLLKALVSIVALTWVLLKIPFGDVWQAVKGADLWLLAIVYLLMTLSLFVRAGRWLALLRGLGVDIGFWRLAELYFVGSFFNSFLPSGFGGDVVRAAEATRDVDSGAAVGTVIVDRLTGLMVLFVMALAALPFSARALPAGVVWPLAGVALLGLVTSVVLLHGGLLRWLAPMMERWLPAKLSRALSPMGDGPVGKVHAAVTGCGWKAVAEALGISVVFNSMLVWWWNLAGIAIGIDAPLIAYVTFVPVLSLSLMVPSIGGLGVREGLSSQLFASAGVGVAEGVALSLILFVLNRGTSVVGGLVYLVTSLRGLKKESLD